jgi:hypothetical protein
MILYASPSAESAAVRTLASRSLICLAITGSVRDGEHTCSPFLENR